MKVEKQVSVQGDWVQKNKDIEDGDKIEILSEGNVVEGEYGERTVFKVETKNGEKLMSFNQTSINNLVDAWGNETKDWIGKDAKVWLNRESVGGKMRYVAYLTAPDWTVDENGNFAPKDGEDIPVVEDREVPPEER